MKNNPCENTKTNIAQEEVNMSRNCRPEPEPIIEKPCKKSFNIDSSLLYFFLILVCILKNSNCSICEDTLLMFFLLLVLIFNNYCCKADC